MKIFQPSIALLSTTIFLLTIWKHQIDMYYKTLLIRSVLIALNDYANPTSETIRNIDLKLVKI